jgi:hypothetical protein
MLNLSDRLIAMRLYCAIFVHCRRANATQPCGYGVFRRTHSLAKAGCECILQLRESFAATA